MDATSWLLLIIVWVIISIIVGSIGEKRSIGFAGAFWASLLLSPILGLLFVIVSEKVDQKNLLKTTKLFNRQMVTTDALIEANNICNYSQKRVSNKDIDGAISDLNHALEVCPGHPLAYYNLACCYSLKINAYESFKHLQLAILNGYNEFEKIKTDPDLTYLREQNNYRDLAESNFKVEMVELNDKPEQPINNKYDLLEKIGQLKEAGILTQEEFEKEKAKILSQTN